MNQTPTKISVSILAADLGRIAEEVRAVCEAGADFIHIDVMDGHFVPNITMGSQIVEHIKKHSRVPLDVHLMITNPKQHVTSFINAGADFITVHAECEDCEGAMAQIIQGGVKAGISVSPHNFSYMENFSKLILNAHLFLVMTVNPGFAGQKFMSEQVKKIIHAKEQAAAISRSDLLVAVDGGMDDKTVAECIKAGADIIVSSSYIFRKDGLSYKEKIDNLRQALLL